jgi:hypothetical protein
MLCIWTYAERFMDFVNLLSKNTLYRYRHFTDLMRVASTMFCNFFRMFDPETMKTLSLSQGSLLKDNIKQTVALYSRCFRGQPLMRFLYYYRF